MPSAMAGLEAPSAHASTGSRPSTKRTASAVCTSTSKHTPAPAAGWVRRQSLSATQAGWLAKAVSGVPIAPRETSACMARSVTALRR